MKNMWLDVAKSHEFADEYMDVPVSKVTRYILLMLGAPVIKIELDEMQVHQAIDEAASRIETWDLDETLWEEGLYEMVLKDGALAYAKRILGHIRRMYVNVDDKGLSLDGMALVNESAQEIKEWQRWLDHLSNLYDYMEDEEDEEEDEFELADEE